MQPEYTLYFFSTCPFCMRVRMFLSENNISVTEKNIRQSEAAYNELLAGGGKTQVPCLKITQADGQEQFMYESADIINYFKALQ